MRRKDVQIYFIVNNGMITRVLSRRKYVKRLMTRDRDTITILLHDDVLVQKKRRATRRSTNNLHNTLKHNVKRKRIILTTFLRIRNSRTNIRIRQRLHSLRTFGVVRRHKVFRKETINETNTTRRQPSRRRHHRHRDGSRQVRAKSFKLRGGRLRFLSRL